ncbi:MAG: hypothetical protein NVS1B10_04730 [Candidatus Saccharimonadales bacterium]
MSEKTYEIGLLQVTSNRALQAGVRRVLNEFSLNAMHWFMLGQISSHEQIKASDLAKLLDVDAPLITMMADALIAKDLTRRVKHPDDGRAKLLILTIKGQTTVALIEGQLEKSMRTLMVGLTEKEMATYAKVLKTTISNNNQLTNNESR